MMKNAILAAFLIVLVLGSKAQNPVRYFSLETLVDSALKHYAISGQAAIQQEIYALQTATIDNGWKPQLMLNGQASYQSDVTKIEVPIPGFNAPEIAKDWYKLNLDITQLIYDGGIARERKKVEEANLAVTLKNIDQQRFHFREQIHTIYFQTLLFDQQIKVQQSVIEGLDELLREMQSTFESGMLLQSEINTLKVERMKLIQQKTRSEAGRKSAIAMLATYSGLPLTASDSLLIPNQENGELTLTNKRPELEVFSLQQDKLHLQESLSKAGRKPLIQAFGQAGYGRPGFNMLDDDFTPYAIAGIRFQYRLYDWKSNQKERNIIRLNARNIDLAKQDFEQNISAAALSKLEEIKQYELLLEQGETIISLQKEILQTAESQLKSGTISSATYVTEFEKYQQSLLNQLGNKLQLQFAVNTFKFITGNIQSYEEQ
jgi:outer membrane protein TolC